jgi:hypothetical protein
MDHKTAGLMLYALQTASINLRNATFEVDEATDVVIDRDDVHRTSLGGPQWFEEDFEAEAAAHEEEDIEEAEEAKEEMNEARLNEVRKNVRTVAPQLVARGSGREAS